ncbi:MAG: GNAT family N-acetyltransferase [Promethearchaeota archaeon]
MKHSENPFVIIDNPSEEEMKIVQKGLENHNKKYPSGELDIPTPDISLVLKDNNGKIVGGIITSMLTGIMHLETLWVEERYRGQGYGRDLVLKAEKIGREKGYTASQTWTFSFQAPVFYQNIGYKVLGVFDGYTDGITEYILLKKFESNKETPYEVDGSNSGRFTISEDASEASMKILNEGLRRYGREKVGMISKMNLEIQIKLVVKNEEGQIIGGLQAYTILKVIHTVCLWIDEKFRNQGYGRELLMSEEKIAIDNSCISGLLNVLSFQSPDFFQKLGYEIFGVSDGYANSIKEYFLIKRF